MNPLTQLGIDAFKNGDKHTARNYFKQALQNQPDDETAWLWLAGTFDDSQARILCLQKVLALNPQNTAAQKGLAQLSADTTPPPAPPEPAPALVSQQEQPIIISGDELWPSEPASPTDLLEPDVEASFTYFEEEFGTVEPDPDLENDLLSSPSPTPLPDNLANPPVEHTLFDEDPDEPLNLADNPRHIDALKVEPLSKARYALRLPDFEEHEIVIKTSFLSKPVLLFDGVPVALDKTSKNYVLTSERGLIAKIEIRPAVFDPLPQVWVDGDKLSLAAPLKWYQWVWMGIPLVALVILGGAIGSIFGIIAAFLNIQVFRSHLPLAVRYLLTLMITLLSVTLYLIVATYISLLIQPGRTI